MTEIKGIYPRNNPDTVRVEESLAGVPDVVVFVGGNGHLDRVGALGLIASVQAFIVEHDERRAAEAARMFRVGDLVTLRTRDYLRANVVISDETEDNLIDIAVVTKPSRSSMPVGTVLTHRHAALYRRLTAEEAAAL